MSSYGGTRPSSSESGQVREHHRNVSSPTLMSKFQRNSGDRGNGGRRRYHEGGRGAASIDKRARMSWMTRSPVRTFDECRQRRSGEREMSMTIRDPLGLTNLVEMKRAQTFYTVHSPTPMISPIRCVDDDEEHVPDEQELKVEQFEIVDDVDDGRTESRSSNDNKCDQVESPTVSPPPPVADDTQTVMPMPVTPPQPSTTTSISSNNAVPSTSRSPPCRPLLAGKYDVRIEVHDGEHMLVMHASKETRVRGVANALRRWVITKDVHVSQESDADENGAIDDSMLWCSKCEVFYTAGLCRKHTLIFCPNVSLKILPMGVENRARRSLECYGCFVIQRSSIAGYGVFLAGEPDMVLPVGMCFGPYEGERVYTSYSTRSSDATDSTFDTGISVEEEHKERVAYAANNGYSWLVRASSSPSTLPELRAEHYVDSSDETISNWMRYVNAANTEEQQNLMAFQYKGGVYYRVSRTIWRDQELLTYYGTGYKQPDRGDHRMPTMPFGLQIKNSTSPLKNIGRRRP